MDCSSIRVQTEDDIRKRLLAVSTEEKTRRGSWLRDRMAEYRDNNLASRDSDPTEEEIKLQIKLPSKEQVEKKRFKEPVCNWIPLEKADVCPLWLTHDKASLPTEEEEDEEDEEDDDEKEAPPHTFMDYKSYFIKYEEDVKRRNIINTRKCRERRERRERRDEASRWHDSRYNRRYDTQYLRKAAVYRGYDKRNRARRTEDRARSNDDRARRYEDRNRSYDDRNRSYDDRNRRYDDRKRRNEDRNRSSLRDYRSRRSLSRSRSPPRHRNYRSLPN